LQELQKKIGRWKRLIDPVFSGNVNPQVNTIVGGNTRGLHLSLKDEYTSLKRELEHDKNGSSVIKGAWDL
jgi:hypothetical protein